MSELLTAALGYAEAKSWPVFPVRPDKTPWIATGFKGATRDPRLIRDWWRRYPEAGIGFAVPEGVLVVDVDPRNGGSLPEGLPQTRTASTRSDGTHAYFMVPAGLSFVGQAAKGVDLKGPGKGYVLLPPTPGYTWVRAGAMAALPQSFIDEWRRSDYDVRETLPTEGVLYLPWEDGTRYGLVALNNQLGNLLCAQNGERNRTLFKAACGLFSLVAGGELSEDKVSTELMSVALEVGLEEYETIRTLQSARDRGFEQPRRAH